jgi:putative flippase GtrA
MAEPTTLPSRSRLPLARLARYGVTGLLSMLTHLGGTVLLVEVAGLRPVVATNIGFAASIAVSYTLQRAWVFGSSRRHREALPRFLSVTALSGGINLLIMAVGHEALGMDYRLAQTIAIVVIPIVNYTANSSWTFRSSGTGPGTALASRSDAAPGSDGASGFDGAPVSDAAPPEPEVRGEGPLDAWSPRVLRHRNAILILVTAWVVAPLVGLTLRGDERYKIYLFGSRHTDDPVALLRYPFETIDMFMGLGNFRPLGRLWELGQYQLVYELSLLTATPAYVVNGVWRVTSAVTVVLVTVWVVGRVLRPFVADVRPFQLLGGFALAASLVAAGNRNPLVVFSGLYLITAAFTVATAGFFAEPRRFGSGSVRGHGRLVWAGLLGMAAASYNELSYLAVPVSAVVLLVGLGADVVTGTRRPIVSALRSRATAAWLVFLSVFAAVAVPTRLRIRQLCAMPGTDCYVASNATVEDWSLRLLVNRIVSAAAPVGWSTTDGGFSPPSLGAAIATLLLGAVVAIVSFLALRAHRSQRPRVERAGAVGLAAVGTALLFTNAVVASLSEQLQQGISLGDGWRETPGAVAGLALLFVAATLLLASLDRLQRPMLLALVVALVLGASVGRTVDFNAQRSASERGSATTVLNNRIAVSLVDLDPSPAGDARRCELQEEFVDAYGRLTRRGMLEAVDVIAEQHLGQPYCVGPAA